MKTNFQPARHTFSKLVGSGFRQKAGLVAAKLSIAAGRFISLRNAALCRDAATTPPPMVDSATTSRYQPSTFNYQPTNKWRSVVAILAVIYGLGIVKMQAADEYWRTDGTTGGTWTSTYWNIGSANATGGTGWTSGNNAVFTANSTLTFATATIGNVTVSANQTV